MNNKRDQTPEDGEEDSKRGKTAENKMDDGGEDVEEKPGAPEDDRLNGIKSNEPIALFQDVKDDPADERNTGERGRHIRRQPSRGSVHFRRIHLRRGNGSGDGRRWLGWINGIGHELSTQAASTVCQVNPECLQVHFASVGWVKPIVLKNTLMQKLSLRAFTLVEMLVVIAIIATLAALLFPAVGGMQERGKATQDMNNLRQLGLATQLYLNDNDGSFPLPTENWMKQLHPKYLGSWKIFKSPFDKRSLLENDATAPVSYGYNANAQVTTPTAGTLSADRISNSSAFILYAPAQDSSSKVNFTGVAGTGVTVDKGGRGSQGAAQGGTHRNRKRINAIMADMHVEDMAWGTVGISGYVNDQSTTTDGNANQRWDPTAPAAP